MPLKLWTTHIPYVMPGKKKQSEVSMFCLQEKLTGITIRGLTSASFCKELNLRLGSRHHLSQPWAVVCLLTWLGTVDYLGKWAHLACNLR